MYIKIQNKAIDKGLTKINFKIFFLGKTNEAHLNIDMDE